MAVIAPPSPPARPSRHPRTPRAPRAARGLGAVLALTALCVGACATGGSPGRTPDRPVAEARLEQRAADASLAPAARAAAWAALGVTRARAERWEDAATAFEASLALGPDEAGVRFDLGVCYRRLGRYPEARDAYVKAASLAPDDVDIPYNLGILYELYLNEPDQALAAYARYVAGGGPEAQKVQGWMESIRRRGSGQGGTSP